jgi:very-short-patch-repair endonuclease
MPDKPKFIAYRSDLKAKAHELRANMTEAEQKLWFGFLRDFPHPVLRQKPIADFIVDFYCSRLKLVIEVDGDSHYEEDAQAYDARRSEVLERLGLRVLRFTNREVTQEFEAVCERIWRALG